MATTTIQGFTNKTLSEHSMPSYALGIKTNYSCVEDEPSCEVLSNKTCPLDLGEKITYRFNDIDKVTTSLTVQNPSKVRNGVQYVAKDEFIQRTSDANGNVLYDEPVVAYLVVRHQKTGTITPEVVNMAVQRVIGSVLKADGTTRFGDMMRGALVVTED